MLTYRRPVDMQVQIESPSLHPNLCLAIRNLMLDEVSNDIERDSPRVRELAARLRRELSLFEMHKRDAFQAVSGADAGSQILPLASRRYAIISALVYSFPSGHRFYLHPESLTYSYSLSGEKFKSTVNVRREAKLYETASCFIETDPEVKLILVDGPLAFSNWWSIAGQGRDRRRLLSAVNRFLKLCAEEGIVVAGIVKRPSARYLVNHLKLQDETDLPDAFLLLQALRPGERTEVFSPRMALRRVGKITSFLDAVDSPILSFYGRFSQDWFIPPIRIDLPAFSLGHLDEIADYCHWSSIWNGIPLPIVRADEEVRISRRFMGEIYKDIVSCVGRLTGDFSHLAPYWGEGGWMGA